MNGSTMARARLQLLTDERAGARVRILVERFCKQHGLPKAATNALNLSLDEIVSNIVMHGYRDKPGRLSIDLRFNRRTVSIMIEDRGRPFDPTRAKAAPMRRPLATRHPGGLGLLFVRNLMDDITYQRAGAINRLQLVKRLSPL